MPTKLKSPLRYPGGKSRAVKFLEPLFPLYEEFREPFVGGGSVFVDQVQKHPDRKFWVNDLNPSVYNFWLQCRDHPDSVAKTVLEIQKRQPVGKELFKVALDVLKQEQNQHPVLWAAAFFILNRITFSGTTESGGYSEQAFKKRFTDSSIDRLIDFGTLVLREDVKITGEDYSDVVNAKGEGVFIFLDPPYYSAEKSALYGKAGSFHKRFDHVRFAETMKRCNHLWLITYDDSPFIRSLFQFALIQEVDFTYGMRNVGKESNQVGKEIIISNF
jgi:DNA adenine methylase